MIKKYLYSLLIYNLVQARLAVHLTLGPTTKDNYGEPTVNVSTGKACCTLNLRSNYQG